MAIQPTTTNHARRYDSYVIKICHTAPPFRSCVYISHHHLLLLCSSTAFLPVCLVHYILMCGVRLPRNPLMMMAMIKWGAGVQGGLLVPVAAALA